MKRRFALLAASAALVFSLTACSARNDTGTGSVNSVNPDTTPSAVPSDQIPGNDANEGGGAGGTNDSNSGTNGNGNSSMPSTNPGNSAQDGNGTNRDDGVLDNVGDAAGDLMRGIGNGVGNALDNVGDAARNGGNAASRSTTPKK